MNQKRVLAGLRAFALAFSILMALVCAPSAQAEVIEVNLVFDLGDSKLGAGTDDFPMGWSTPFIPIPKVRPVAGDSLRISVSFVDRSTGQPQRLRISDLGFGEAVEQMFARADGDPFLSVKAFTLNSFTFHNVMGEILPYPISVPVITGGAGIGANTFPNLTDTSFSFTGITWQIDFSEMTYLSGDGFTLTLFAMGADKIEVIQTVSVAIDIEPGTCPNLLNAKSHGHVKVSIEGTANFDVTTVDPASVRLQGVSADRSMLRDVSGQLDTLHCSHGKPDGFTDLVLNFDTQSIVATIGDVQDGDVRTLTLTGTLADGTPIQGEDVVVIKKPGKR